MGAVHEKEVRVSKGARLMMSTRSIMGHWQLNIAGAFPAQTENAHLTDSTPLAPSKARNGKS